MAAPALCRPGGRSEYLVHLHGGLAGEPEINCPRLDTPGSGQGIACRALSCDRDVVEWQNESLARRVPCVRRGYGVLPVPARGYRRVDRRRSRVMDPAC